MKLQEALREIQSLKKKVRSLTEEIESIKTASVEDPSPVEKMLKMRGINVFRKNPTDRLFFPPDLSPFYKNRFYEMMKKYSFRLVLRDMIKIPGWVSDPGSDPLLFFQGGSRILSPAL